MSDNPQPQDSTDFGFTLVPRSAKRGLVQGVFNSVARRYDLMNDLMSLGLHRAWKDVLLTELAPHPGDCLVDLAAGSGDVGFRWLARNGGRVIMTDINEAMLAVGRRRALEQASIADLMMIVADAEQLPLPDRTADRVSIAFGLRNCTNKEAVLAEARRILRPGGKFCCLEFSHMHVAALAPAYDAWSFRVLPLLGRLVAGDAPSYRYLAESIRTFPDQETLAVMMQKSGFARVSVRSLSGGIAAIHTGWRL